MEDDFLGETIAFTLLPKEVLKILEKIHTVPVVVFFSGTTFVNSDTTNIGRK